MLPNLQADMTITADAVEEEEDMAEVGIVEEDGEVMTTVVAEVEDMAAVTVSFCLYPQQGLLLFVLHP
jgi:hypothetical protein